jgi:hypothetical protein
LLLILFMNHYNNIFSITKNYRGFIEPFSTLGPTAYQL